MFEIVQGDKRENNPGREKYKTGKERVQLSRIFFLGPLKISNYRKMFRQLVIEIEIHF